MVQPHCNRVPALDQRTFTALPNVPWRRLPERNLPSFFLHDSGYSNFSDVAHELRTFIGAGRIAEETLPIAFAQYLVDMPLIEALAKHPQRVLKPEHARFHILAALPFTSRLLCLLKAGVCADGNSICQRGQRSCQPLYRWSSASNKLRLAVEKAHRWRLHRLVSYLTRNAFWQRPGVPFLLLSTGIDIGHDLSDNLLHALNERNRYVGPVILAGVDRSGPHEKVSSHLPLLRRMIVLPHVASPEATRSATSQVATQAQTPAAARAEVIGGGPPPPPSPRTGFLFHGHHYRFDAGARAAVRDYGRLILSAPVDFRGVRLMLISGAQNASWREAHEAQRRISQETTAAMGRHAMCFAPQGDSDSSRRLFDALATGCVPVVVKSIGGKPKEALLANLPFHRTLEWRALAFFIAAGGAKVKDRFQEVDEGTWMFSCRTEEAKLLDGWHADTSTLQQLRANGLAAFREALDIEYNPRGVATALLRELAHVLDDKPPSIYLPPPFLLRDPLMHLWPNMSTFSYLWK